MHCEATKRRENDSKRKRVKKNFKQNIMIEMTIAMVNSMHKLFYCLIICMGIWTKLKIRFVYLIVRTWLGYNIYASILDLLMPKNTEWYVEFLGTIFRLPKISFEYALYVYAPHTYQAIEDITEIFPESILYICWTVPA